jgi:hypothetical protein
VSRINDFVNSSPVRAKATVASAAAAVAAFISIYIKEALEKRIDK